MIVGKNVKLIKFSSDYITDDYIKWLNSYDINKFLYTGRMPVSKEDIKDRNNNNNIMYAVLSNVSVVNNQSINSNNFDKYIGTVSIGNIDWITRKAEIGYIIGDKNYWGRGLASQMISLVVDYCFNRLNLNKLEAGVVDGNDASIKVLVKNGFTEYGITPQDHYVDGKYLSAHKFYLLNKNQ